MKDFGYSVYEVINIPEMSPEDRIKMANVRIVESPWVTCCDGTTGESWQYHKITNERREVPEGWFS